MKRAAIALVFVACGSPQRDPAPPPSGPPENTAAKATLTLPLPAGTHIPCDQLLDAAVLTEALSQTAALSIRDSTSDPGAVSSCGLIRGGKRPDEREQAELYKRGGLVGPLPGDELCRITVSCTTVQEKETFLAQCQSQGLVPAPTVSDAACKDVIASGVYDVDRYRILDDDTGCVLAVQGGPSVFDNDLILLCAQTARTHITPSRLGAR